MSTTDVCGYSTALVALRCVRVAVCCSALQCVAVCGSVLQCVAVCTRNVCGCSTTLVALLQCVAVCCSVWQCAPEMFMGAALLSSPCCEAAAASMFILKESGSIESECPPYCSVLQCVAVCCSVLQCVAVCCSMSQCGAAQCVL